MKKLGLLILVTAGITFNAFAQGDAEAGKNKATECAACHGPDGNSAIELNPKLAGQHASYLVKQLQDFQLAAETSGDEGRNSPIMNGIAAPLSEQEMHNLAAYFESQEQKVGTTPEDVVEPGQALYMGGDEERGITACTACHGPRGNGMGLAKFPNISGQHTAYVKPQLEAFRSGQRDNDLNGMMRDIAKRLTDEDIEILSKYVAGLH